MTGLEILWLFLAFVIIFIILSTDPKSASGDIGDNNSTVLFLSVTESQKFFRSFTWSLVFLFYIATLLINR